MPRTQSQGTLDEASIVWKPRYRGNPLRTYLALANAHPESHHNVERHAREDVWKPAKDARR